MHLFVDKKLYEPKVSAYFDSNAVSGLFIQKALSIIDIVQDKYCRLYCHRLKGKKVMFLLPG
jgi:hypothetical protein